MEIISITGTKGKTTITRALSSILNDSGQNVLRVDTDGHYINEKQESTLQDARNLFFKAPTVCPGKYLISMKDYFPDFAAVLETSVGSNGPHGLGYGFHDVGIFANVFEDHLGVSDNLKTRKDLAKAKSFIFRNISEGGCAIFNADDEFVCSQLGELPKDRKIELLPVGVNFDFFESGEHLARGGELITVEGDFIVIKSGKSKNKIINFKKIPWTFKGNFMPSVFNLMFIVGVLYSFSKKKIVNFNELIELVEKYRLDDQGGRLTLLRNDKDVNVIVDYAHEKYSLKEIAKLGNSLKKNRLIGVVRLAPDRPDDAILETGKYIANEFDDLVIYDKIDGVFRDKYVGKNYNVTREIGEVSGLFIKGVLSSKKEGLVERVVFEGDAIKRAAEISSPGDLVVVICNDDHSRTIEFVKKYFSAELT